MKVPLCPAENYIVDKGKTHISKFNLYLNMRDSSHRQANAHLCNVIYIIK